MNKYYNNCLDVYLHFLLVVEVIKLNRILDLWMTLDATYCDVQLIYGYRNILKVERQSEYDNLKHWTA